MNCQQIAEEEKKDSLEKDHFASWKVIEASAFSVVEMTKIPNLLPEEEN